MRRALVCVALLVVTAVATASPTAAGLPRSGKLVPGRSLAGVRLGETAAEVKHTLGTRYGICRGCARPTWYFTYARFDKHGLAVELTRDRVTAVYTLWQPQGWTMPGGVSLGALTAAVTAKTGPLLTISCIGYEALVRDAHGVRTAYYIVDDRLWGFGLVHALGDPCR